MREVPYSRRRENEIYGLHGGRYGDMVMLVFGADDPCSQRAQEGGIDGRSTTSGGYDSTCCG